MLMCLCLDIDRLTNEIEDMKRVTNISRNANVDLSMYTQTCKNILDRKLSIDQEEISDDVINEYRCVVELMIDYMVIGELVELCRMFGDDSIEVAVSLITSDENRSNNNKMIAPIISSDKTNKDLIRSLYKMISKIRSMQNRNRFVYTKIDRAFMKLGDYAMRYKQTND